MPSSSARVDALFAAMVSGYTTQALVALGKIANPLTGKTDRDLEQAKTMIDILEMIEAKTEGNRSSEETSALRQSISTLRLNFVDEAQKERRGGAGEEQTAPPEEPGVSNETGTDRGDAPPSGASSRR